MDVRAPLAAPLAPKLAPPAAAPSERDAPDGVASFGEVLAGALAALQRSHDQADTLAGALAAGANVDLHEVALALEEANLATQLAVQVRNKLVEAYQEISRMPI